MSGLCCNGLGEIGRLILWACDVLLGEACLGFLGFGMGDRYPASWVIGGLEAVPWNGVGLAGWRH
eukprot:115757-Ditylum_brightwellii.AAC.1